MTHPDASAATAALEAADAVPALEAAIAAAAWLDDHPGEDRQKLRAARTRLRKALAASDEAAAAGGDGRGSAAERSPHAKASYDAAEFEALSGSYESLKWRLISKPGGATVKPDHFYRRARARARRGAARTATRASAGDQAKFVAAYYEFPPSALYADTRGGVSA
ncbi:hypothetical protein HT031_000188 [Scenedesmus sp. PABB004]|nr:hypothetical protein HT031_000188 [Scenedesmus sp. PABB004]